MKKKLILKTGCSGYYNRHWKKIFYPEKLAQSKWFEFYCEQFSTVELNSTFYKFPTTQSLNTWYKKAPAGFVFSVKAPKLITHFKRFNDCEREISEFYLACREGLKEKLACTLFQLPPNIQYSEEKLEQIIGSLDRSFTNVIEFRHPGWWKKKVYDTLAEHKIIFCSVSHPSMPDDIVVNTETAYVRLHGVPKMFYSGYTNEQLEHLYKFIIKKRKVKDGYVYFNNTAADEGVLNALEFQKLVKT